MLASTALLLGIPNGVSRYLPRSEERGFRRGVLVSAFQIVLPTALVGSLALFVLSEVFASWLADSGTAVALRIFSIALPFMVVFRLCLGAVRGVESSTPRVLLKNFLLPISRFGFVILFVTIGADLFGISLAYALPYVLVACVALYFVNELTDLFESSVSANQMHKELLRFSLPVVITGTMFSILTKIDSILLGLLLSSTEPVGVYRAVYPLARLLLVAMLSFNYILMPVLSRLDKRDNIAEMRHIYRTATKWIFAVSFPILLIYFTFSKTVITYTFGGKYTTGSLALTILATGFFIRSVAGPNDSALQSIGKTKTVMIDSIVVTILNVVLNIVLIPHHGVIGAAVATSITFIIFNILMIYQLNREVGIQPFSRPMLTILVVAVCSYLVALAVPLTSTGRIRLLVVLAVFVPMYFVFLWTFVVGDAEHELLSEAKSAF